ncbi:MAG TPA: universal stress protein [Bacteroidia bacterium]|nr:universal stress protein [Bacteroidia bacterium]
MKLIICPTDFSLSATNAIRYAAELALEFHSRIILLHTYEAPIMYSEIPLTSISFADEQVKGAVGKKLNALKNKLSKEFKGVSFETMITQGLAHEQIVGLADKMAADLIILGTTGTNKMERLLMGSTTARVIRDAHCPVLCVPKNTGYTAIKKIVFSTDLREDNIRSAMMITPFASKFKAEIIFLFVDDKHILHSDEEIEKMTQKIRKRVKYPALSGYVAKNTKITKGIEYFLEKKPADLLVMFTHPKHFPESLFNSSMTNLMSHQTKIPLLALKIDDRPIMGKL